MERSEHYSDVMEKIKAAHKSGGQYVKALLAENNAITEWLDAYMDGDAAESEYVEVIQAVAAEHANARRCLELVNERLKSLLAAKAGPAVEIWHRDGDEGQGV